MLETKDFSMGKFGDKNFKIWPKLTFSSKKNTKMDTS